METLASDLMSPPRRVVLGNISTNSQGPAGGSPISPMANLKLLTKVATGEVSLWAHEPAPKPAPAPEKLSRKSRSLGHICNKFLMLYNLDIPRGQYKQLSLGQLAAALEIEKRRVYDIINVVASLQMAVKVCKDRYNWFGNQRLAQVLSQLKCYALQNNLDGLVWAVKRTIDQCLANNISEAGISESLSNDPVIKHLLSEHPLFEDSRIGTLCQKFIMMFLVSKEGTSLSLTLISKVILPKDVQDKTGMRRLYDIANVLESLGLIKRHSKVFKRPTYMYCGPEVMPVPCNPTEPYPNIMNPPSPVDPEESDSSLDTTTFNNKLNSMLEVVCTELKKIDDKINPMKPERPAPSAKKRLFPMPCKLVAKGEAYNSTFVKAPSHSFRWMSSGIHPKPSVDTQPAFKPRGESNDDNNNQRTEDNNNLPSRPLSPRGVGSSEVTSTVPDLQELPAKVRVVGKQLPPINIGQLGRSVTILKPVRLNEIQNGGLYKAVKNGNVIHLVKL